MYIYDVDDEEEVEDVVEEEFILSIKSNIEQPSQSASTYCFNSLYTVTA